MKALVTGSSGFIGRRVRARLGELGYQVVGMDKQAGLPVQTFVQQSTSYYDLVVHCAAVVGGRALIESPELAHAENMEIDIALLRWAQKTKPGRLVYVSSVAAYPVRLQTFWQAPLLRERDINWLGHLDMPDDLYGWGKLTGELLAERVRDLGVPVTVVRPFGAYGPGGDRRTPFPDFAHQASMHADPIRVWGLGNQVRDFIHVSDVVESIVVLAQQGVNVPVNVCSGRAVRLNEAARMFADEAGYSPDIVGDESKAAGLEYRVGSTVELHKHYVPVISLEQGIKDMMGKQEL